jgi:hypothetical protein
MSSPEEQYRPMPPADHHVPPPGTVTTASVLWVANGVLVTLAFAYQGLQYLGTYGDVGAATFCGVFVAGGVLIWRFGSRLRHGHDKRTVLTVLGAVSGLALFTLLLVVPAIVLQYRPASRRWFALTPAEAP